VETQETQTVMEPKTPRERRRRDGALRGRVSLFRYKVRKPVSLTLTEEHHEKVNRNMRRLGLSRADLIALLIDRHADTAQLP
jgi:hypothetical protein